MSGGEWQKHGLADSDVLEVGDCCPDGLQRVSASSLSHEEFVERFERPGVPVIITGLTDAWPASKLWTDERLLREFGEHRFKVDWLLGVCGGRVCKGVGVVTALPPSVSEHNACAKGCAAS